MRLRFVSNRFWASDECRAADEAPEAGCNWLDGKWHYLELDVAGMLQKNFSGATLTTLDALIVRGRTVYLDDPVVSDGYLDKTYLVLPGAPVGGVLAAQAGPLAAETRTKAGGHDRWWYHTNELGTVMATTDYTGQPIGVYFPDSLGNYPYGTTTGIRPDGLGLSGKLFDEDAGAYYYGARWLDPDRGRWLSQEPTGADGSNLYHYVFNNSYGAFDLNGLVTIEVRYIEVKLGIYHSYIIVTDDNGKQYVFRGGPSISAYGWFTGNSSPFGPITTSVADYNTKHRDWGGHLCFVVAHNSKDAGPIIETLKNFTQNVNSRHIPYWVFGRNSNTSAYEALRELYRRGEIDFVPTPPVVAPGWKKRF